MENSRNGTDRATERSGPCNGTKRTVERNGTDRFTPFLGKRYRRATQTERTVFRTFFRRVPYLRSTVIEQQKGSWQFSDHYRARARATYMDLTEYTKRIALFEAEDYRPSTIVIMLKSEGNYGGTFFDAYRIYK